MKSVKIYLRSIEHGGKKSLAMFDSNRNGDIDNLVTNVPSGTSVIWSLDCCSGIKNIIKIYSKKGMRNVFKMDPSKRMFCKGLKLYIPKEAEGEEAYAIDYILCDGSRHSIDPVIKIDPPKQ
jgi:hypothetical protein